MFTCLLCWLNIGLLCGGDSLVQLWPDQHSGSLNNLKKALPSLLLHLQIVRTRTITIGPVLHPLFLNSDEKKNDDEDGDDDYYCCCCFPVA